jgi:hypothetical protein
MTIARKPRPRSTEKPAKRPDNESQGIRKDQRGQEQPADKKRAQKNR